MSNNFLLITESADLILSLLNATEYDFILTEYSIRIRIHGNTLVYSITSNVYYQVINGTFASSSEARLLLSL